MRPAARPLYRVRQFFRHITATYTLQDDAFVQRLLTPLEHELFKKFPVFEKQHAVDVARYFERYRGVLPDTDLRCMQIVGILHDIGKVEQALNPVEKSAFVVLRLLFPWLVEWMARRRQKNKASIFLYHNEIGAKMLERIGTNGRVVEIIREYAPGKSLGKLATLLADADEQIL